MKVRNVRPRRFITIQHGVVSSRITTLICKKGCKTSAGKPESRRPEELEYLVPPGANIGYDVEIFCGTKRYLEGLQREEIKKQLENEHGIFISSREISLLANRFVEHFKKLHASRCQAIREVLKRDGGTPWHVDATGEEGSGTVLIVYAGWREWVLGTRKITTECTEQIKPLLHETANQFGNPCAVVRDYGKGMTPAIEQFVQECKVKIIILGCHTHFIKFVGKDLLTSEYNALRQLIRNHNIRAKLRRIVKEWGKDIGEENSELKEKIESWISLNQAHLLPKGNMGLAIIRAMAQNALDYLENNKNQRFPFVLPYDEFYQRCKTLYHACEFYMNYSQTDKSVLQALKRLTRVLAPVISDSSFEQIDQTLSYRFKLFTELRIALRLNSEEAIKKVKPGVQEPQSVAKELNDIKKALRKYKVSLQDRYLHKEPAKEKRQAIDTILKHLKMHEKNLWGHVIRMPKSVGGGIKIVCRTNNCLENFNGRLKQEERKRSGRKVLTKDFEDLPEGVPLIKNLKKLDYVEILCGSLENLPAAIGKLDHDERVKKSGNRTQPIKTEFSATSSLPKEDRQFIRKINIGLLIQNAAALNRAKTSTFAR
jgi:ElaB/YqjD/DUF883 family membrane-anchored ribosome-binding protein